MDLEDNKAQNNVGWCNYSHTTDLVFNSIFLGIRDSAYVIFSNINHATKSFYVFAP